MSEKQNCLCTTGKCQTYYELPPCITFPVKESPQPKIVEDWKQLSQHALIRFEKFVMHSKCPLINFHSKYYYDWKDLYMRAWKRLNPRPDITLRDAYNQSLAQISALEAALAEKGGDR